MELHANLETLESCIICLIPVLVGLTYYTLALVVLLEEPSVLRVVLQVPFVSPSVLILQASYFIFSPTDMLYFWFFASSNSFYTS